MNNSLWWCDKCYKTKYNPINDELYNEYFSCYTTQHMIQHRTSKKHITQEELIKSLSNGESGSDSREDCKRCKQSFTKEGYAIHKQRNKPLWDMKDLGHSEVSKMSCNNFFVGLSKRYHSISAWKDSKKPKGIVKRCKIGQNGRTKNKKKGEVVEEDLEEEISTEDEELEAEEIINRMTKTLRIKNEETNKWEYKPNPAYDSSIKSAVIKNKDRLEEKWACLTEKPQLDEICDNCSLGINTEYPIKLLEKWEIKSCGCLSTEDESD